MPEAMPKATAHAREQDQKKPRRPQDAGLPRRGTLAKNVDDAMGMLAPPA